MTKTIALLASDGAQVLDITGPAAVFSGANTALPERMPYTVRTLSPAGGLIETMSGIALHTETIEAVAPSAIDTLLVCGHDRAGTQALNANRAARDWTRAVAGRARRWGSVCSGAFALAHWGLLDGKRAATHWANSDELAARYGQVRVDRNALYVVDGKTWTSAGVTAGIDMSLAMVEADLGADVAAEIARHLVVYLRRPGSQSQFSRVLQRQCEAASPYGDLIAWAGVNLGHNLTVEALADKASQSLRTFQRRFAQSMGRSPAGFIEDLRLERAKALIGAGVALKTVASDIGYASASRLTSVFRRRVGLSPSVWKAVHAGPGQA